MDKSSKTILVVDDVADNIMLLKSILQMENYKVKVANNGAKCIDIANKFPQPDLILLDIMMPNISGYDVCKELKSNNNTKNIPVIFITAKNEIEDESLGFELGAVDYINKPICDAIVLARVKTQLELRDLINNLNEKVNYETQLRVKHEKSLMQKNKSAAMGDMIDAIAHQWKTPLSIMSMNLQLLELDIDSDNLKINVEKCLQKTQIQIKHLTETIDEFRDFFKPVDSDKCFNIAESITKTISLVNDELMLNKINIKTDLKDTMIINGNSSEFIHILINLISNARDAFIQRNIVERNININLYKKESENAIVLDVIDNAGGIEESIIENIFKPRVSTKKDTGGTGIGLYLSSQIAEKLGGSLKAENINNGVKFIFKKIIE